MVGLLVVTIARRIRPLTVVLVVTIARRIRPLTVVLVVTIARRIRPLTVVSTGIHRYPPVSRIRLRPDLRHWSSLPHIAFMPWVAAKGHGGTRRAA
jgi:hypothetical protein